MILLLTISAPLLRCNLKPHNLRKKAMFDASLSLTDQGTNLSNIGAGGTLVYELVSQDLNGSLRRVAATAMTTRKELLLRSQLTGKGYGTRHRYNMLYRYSVINQDTSVTGGIIPSLSISCTVDRPNNMGSIITDAIVKNSMGYLLALQITSGYAAKMFNSEV